MSGPLKLPLELQRGEILLRQWKESDFAFYSGFLGNQETARFYGGVLEEQKAWRHLASLAGHWNLKGFGVYTAARSVDGQPQGCVGLWEPFGWPCREFVFWFTPPAYVDGLARDALQLGLDQVKASFPGEAIQGFIHPDNFDAIQLAQIAGGVGEGPMPLADYGPHLRFSYTHI